MKRNSVWIVEQNHNGVWWPLYAEHVYKTKHAASAAIKVLLSRGFGKEEYRPQKYSAESEG